MQTQTIRPLREVALELADAHRAADPETTIVKLFSSPQDDEIRLLEVSSAVPATGEALPFRFAPSPTNGINYPSVVVLLNTSEWTAVENELMPLPAGWELASAKDI